VERTKQATVAFDLERADMADREIESKGDTLGGNSAEPFGHFMPL